MRLEVLLILALILVGGLIYYKDGNFTNLPTFSFFSSQKDNDEELDTEKTSIVSKIPFVGSSDTAKANNTQVLSNDEIEEKVTEVYEKLDTLQGDLREVELREPVSPFAGMITLAKGNAQATDPQKEYVLLTAQSGNTGAIGISNWYLESFVTNSEAHLPEGAALLNAHDSRSSEPIFLQAGERAYVTTGETPLRTSFRENLCTGYLTEYESFSPTLNKSCPLPGDEMLQFASINKSDNECFEFVEDINKCEIIDSEERLKADLSSSCNSFIKNVLDYEGCVDKHVNDYDFYNYGDWRIYLDREGELWRSTREIIRLMDGEGRVVDVIEY